MYFRCGIVALALLCALVQYGYERIVCDYLLMYKRQQTTTRCCGRGGQPEEIVG